MTDEPVRQAAQVVSSAIHELMDRLRDVGYREDSEEMLTLSSALGVSHIWNITIIEMCSSDPL